MMSSIHTGVMDVCPRFLLWSLPSVGKGLPAKQSHQMYKNSCLKKLSPNYNKRDGIIYKAKKEGGGKAE